MGKEEGAMSPAENNRNGGILGGESLSCQQNGSQGSTDDSAVDGIDGTAWGGEEFPLVRVG